MDEFETDHPRDGEPDGFGTTAVDAGIDLDVDAAGFQVDFEHSGHPRVDDVLDRLTRLPDTALPGHADVYDTIHGDLRAILADQPAGAQASAVSGK